MNEIEAIFKNPIAHRGLHERKKGIIENSKTAFARAINAGYAIECDLQLSGDGVAMVFHDSVLERVTKQSGQLAKLSAGQLSRIRLTASKKGDTPSRFSQLLEQVQGKVPLVVELKSQSDGRNEELAKAAVLEAGTYDGPLAFKSFNPKLLQLVKGAGFTGPIGIIVNNASADDKQFKSLTPQQRFYLRHLLHYPKTKFDFISSDRNALNMPAIRLFRRFGFPVMTWTIPSYEIERTTRGHADQLVFENYAPYVTKN